MEYKKNYHDNFVEIFTRINLSKQEGYAINFETDKFEKKLNDVINTTSLNDLGCSNNDL